MLPPMKTIIQSVLTSITLVWLATAIPNMQAVVPAPDGGYPNLTTAEGQNALLHLTTGVANTAVGWLSLESVTTGSANTGLGAGTLVLNTGDDNTATGAAALLSNTTGPQNTANGAFALFNNIDGGDNTANGASALFSNTGGDDNTAIGNSALYSNTIGFQNTAVGAFSLHNNVSGSENTALGDNAGHVITGTGNVCIGSGLGGVDGVDNTTWIRNVYDSVASARAVYVNADNKIGTLSSSRRYKDEIRPMAQASEAILSLRPVSFRYKKEVDRTRSLSFGLIAEEVAQVDPDLVTPDRHGKPETVRYEAVNAMLLNEFLKEHRKVQELEKGMATLTAQFKEQAAQIQKVSALLEMNNAAPRMTASNP